MSIVSCLNQFSVDEGTRTRLVAGFTDVACEGWTVVRGEAYR